MIKVSKKYGYFWSDQQDPDPLFYEVDPRIKIKQIRNPT